MTVKIYKKGKLIFFFLNMPEVAHVQIKTATVSKDYNSRQN